MPRSLRRFVNQATKLFLLFPLVLVAQTATLSGTATDPKGKDFKIDRPSFLTLRIKNEIPKVELAWHKM